MKHNYKKIIQAENIKAILTLNEDHELEYSNILTNYLIKTDKILIIYIKKKVFLNRNGTQWESISCKFKYVTTLELRV